MIVHCIHDMLHVCFLHITVYRVSAPIIRYGIGECKGAVSAKQKNMKIKHIGKEITLRVFIVKKERKSLRKFLLRYNYRKRRLRLSAPNKTLFL